MRRDELAYLLRAAATIAGDGRILVVGRQAILGSYSEEELPEAAWISIEADLVFLDPDGGADRADQVDGAIGELSQFHAESATTRRSDVDIERGTVAVRGALSERSTGEMVSPG